MKRKLDEYLDFLYTKGKTLVFVPNETLENPSYALSLDDALDAIEILRKAKAAIVCYDFYVLCDDSTFAYDFHIWGSQYYQVYKCERCDNETFLNYCERSYSKAIKDILNEKMLAEKFGSVCYVEIFEEEDIEDRLEELNREGRYP